MLSAEMLNNIEGVHVVFLQQVTGMKARRLGDGTWKKEGPERVIQVAGTKPLQEYIDKRQATVSEWAELRPIFEVCTKDTGYEGGGKLRGPWWRQEAAEQQLETTLKNVLPAAGKCRRKESKRRGGGKGWEGELVSGSDG